MRHRHPVLAAAALTLVFAPHARAQTSYPMLTRIEPVAAQRGQAVEIKIGGAGSFAGAWQVLCEGPGLSAEVVGVVKPEATPAKGRRRRPGGAVTARLAVARDAPLGPREVRVATPQGVSSVGLVVVVDDPVVVEADDRANDRPDTAQTIALPAVVAGAIGKPEDVDWYAFPGRAGQRITFSVWANRLEDKIHDLQMHFDPILALHDAHGRELAVDDNHDFADPRFSYAFKEDGTYLLQIRDTTYAGNQNWTYALQVTAGPSATSVFPMAVNPRSRATLSAQGVNFDARQAIVLEVPGDLTPGPRLFALPTAQGPTLAVPMVVTPLPLALEAGDAQTSTARAQAITMPVALSGRLVEANDIDAYRFEAKKGQAYVFEVVARRAGAATDPVLRVLNLRDATLAEADDSPGSKDPKLDWTAPADGLYALQVADLHSRGGEEFGYVLQATVATPDFTLGCDPDKLNVGPGARVPMFVQVTRRAGFTGPVTLRWEGLPPGVSASPLTIPAELTQGVIVVEAAADAKPAAALLSFSGNGQAPGGSIVRKVQPKQEIYVPGGGRATYPVGTIALAVTDPSDITVEASTTALTLPPGGTAAIDVKVTRHGGYDKGVNLAIVYQHLGGVFANPLPPGVTVKEAGSKTLLGPTETSGKIILQAKADAPACDKVPIAVMGHVSINFVVKTSYSTAPILLTVPRR